MQNIVTAALFVLAAGHAGDAATVSDFPEGAGVVLGTVAVADGLRFCSRNAPTGVSGFWEVPTEDVPPIDVALLKYMHASRLDKRLKLPTSKYQRQYLGFLRGERRFVYINAFPAYFLLAVRDSTKVLPRMCDGGAITWGIEYDVKERRFLALAPNF